MHDVRALDLTCDQLFNQSTFLIQKKIFSFFLRNLYSQAAGAWFKLITNLVFPFGQK